MPSHKQVTIYDIARALDLSPSTISRGLRKHPSIREETSLRIRETARKMNYQQNTFASSLRKNRSHTIGVVLPKFEGTFMASVISGIEMVIRSNDYRLVVSQSFDSNPMERENLDSMFNSRVEGLLISLVPETEELNHLDMFFRRGTPVVLLDRAGEQGDHRCTRVVIDNRAAGYDATRHLIEQGCRRIVYLGENVHCMVYGGRASGYRQALEEAGMAIDESMILTDTLNEGSGRRTLKKILAMNEAPDGIFAANDTAAVSVLTALKEYGYSIPRDMAVVGFNNQLISRIVEPPLTTVNYPAVEMGKIAARSLLEMLDQDSQVATQDIVLRHELIVRASSLRNP
jgi:LacI family transcriptional regulator